MIRTVIAALVCIASVPAVAWTPPQNSDAVAIIIGNRNYAEHGHGVPDVDFAHNDAAAFARFARELLGVSERKIFVREDVNAAGMLQLFGTERNPRGLVRQLAELGNREIYVFYSGHGVPAVRPEGLPEGYLLPVDVSGGQPDFGGYSLDLLLKQLAALPADRVTVFLDACFSGQSEAGVLTPAVSGAFGVAVAAPERTATVSVLSATAFDRPQVAHWLPEKEMGAFTYFMLRGLYGEADGYGRADGRVMLEEVAAYLKDTLSIEILSRRGGDQVASLRGRLDVPLTRFDGGSGPPFPFERVVGTFEEPWTAPAEPGARFREPLEGGGEGPEMVVIPSGSFWMGSPPDEVGRSADEGPQHRREIARFALGRTEVTFDEWQACVDDGGCRSNPRPNDEGWGRGSRPAINVSWNDAQEFVDWMNGKVEGEPYRLPSESEWEYAVRANTAGGRNEPAYHFGSMITRWQANFSNVSGTDRVDDLLAAENDWDLRHMHGNVWEWTEDCWHDSYRGAPSDGRPWLQESNGDCARRVVRGGSWFASPQFLRSASRHWFPPEVRISFFGFRLARTLATASDVVKKISTESAPANNLDLNPDESAAYAEAVRSAIFPVFTREIASFHGAGTVVVEVVIARDGSARSTRIVQSSGFGELDAGSLAAARATRYPPLPGGRDSLTVHIPLLVR